jgi:MFS family permease
MKREMFKRYFQFLLVVLAAGAIYPVIYLRGSYQETILEVFNMTLPQLNTIYSILGIVFVLGYFPSGLLSDKFSAKKLLAISLFGTSVGGFWFAQVPNYTSVILIFCIWGTFSVFTFWSAHLKIVKMIAKENEEGKFFGILDGGRGVVEAGLASVALLIFSGILGNSLELLDKKAALVAVIYMYSGVLLVTSLLIMFFVEDDKKVSDESKEAVERERFQFSDLAKVFKNKLVYLHGSIVFAGYVVFWTYYYLGGFLQTNIGVNPVSVGTIMVVVLWMRPVGGILAGFLADRFGKTNIIMSALAGASICLVAIALLPVTTGTAVFYSLIVLLAIFLYAIRGTYWSLLGDAKIKATILGTAIGVISFIGYSPDILLPQFNSFLWNAFGENGGYNAYFISSAVMGVVGLVLAFIFRKITKQKQKPIVTDSKIVINE